MKKGQITMEALLLYGAAILVVLLAVAALIYFGVLDLGVFLPEKCSFASSGLSCEEYQISTVDKTISLVLANKGTKSIDINSAVFEAKDTGLVNRCTGESTILPLTIIPGDKRTLVINCLDWNANTGKKVAGKITLVQKFTGGTLDTTTVGDLTATAS
jgi:hypothetical protein